MKQKLIQEKKNQMKRNDGQKKKWTIHQTLIWFSETIIKRRLFRISAFYYFNWPVCISYISLESSIVIVCSESINQIIVNNITLVIGLWSLNERFTKALRSGPTGVVLYTNVLHIVVRCVTDCIIFLSYLYVPLRVSVYFLSLCI